MDPLQPVPHVNLMMDTFIANSSVEDLRAVVRALLVCGPPNTTSAFQKVVKQRLRRQRPTDNLPPPSSLYASFGQSHRLLHHNHPYSSPSSASSSSSLPVSSNASAASASSSFIDTPPSSNAGSPPTLRLSRTLSDSPSPSASEPIIDTDPIFTPSANSLLARARALFGAGLALEALPLLTVLVQGTHGLRWAEEGSFGDALAVLDGDISQAIQSSAEEVAQSALSSNPKAEEGWIEDGLRAVEDLSKALKACEDEVEAWGGEFPFQRGLANVEWLEGSDGWMRNMLGRVGR